MGHTKLVFPYCIDDLRMTECLLSYRLSPFRKASGLSSYTKCGQSLASSTPVSIRGWVALFHWLKR